MVDSGSNINRLMLEELLSHDRRVEKHLIPPRFEPLPSRSITKCTNALRSESNRDHSKMKNESMKKSLEKSKNVLKKIAKWSSKKFA